jgi:hypothetical protein
LDPEAEGAGGASVVPLRPHGADDAALRDKRRPARGIALGLVIGVIMWLVILYGAFALLG